MTSRLLRGTAAASLGAVAGAVLLVAVYTSSPRLFIGMDLDLPAVARGFYPVERSGGLTFAWTSERAEIELEGFDRRIPWSCDVILRGGRPDSSILPEVRYAVDGKVTLARTATNALERVKIDIPQRTGGRNGLHLSLDVSNTFIPGPGDRRRLGVVVDAVSCQPDPGHLALPRRSAIVVAAISAAIFGAAFGLAGVTAGSAIGGGVLIALAQAFPLARGLGPFASYLTWIPGLAFWIAAGMTGIVWAIEWTGGQRLRNTARFAVLFSGAMLYLKLLVLLHPDKHVGDALFHAHRLEWVMDGRYLFTSIAPGGYRFPYPIALYLLAEPFSLFTPNHVALLRVIVATVDSVAGALLYAMIVRHWGDRLAGALAVALFLLTPLSFAVQATGNLTNAFGQSISTAAMAALTTIPVERRSVRWIAGSVALVLIALLSHTSTFVLLSASALLMAAFCWLAGHPTRRLAPALALIVVSASLLAVGLYYGRFGDVYRAQFRRISGEMAASLTTGQPAVSQTRSAGGSTIQIVRRAAAIPRRVNFGFGAVAALAIAGVWHLRPFRARDTLRLAIAAWLAASALFLAVGILTPIDLRYYLSAIPAVAMLAGAGAAWSWRGGRSLRFVGLVAVAWVVVAFLRQWLGEITWTT